MKTVVADKTRRPNAPVWVKVLVFLHLFAITVWAMPTPPDAMMRGTQKPIGTDWLLVANQNYLKSIKPLQAYLMASGMWQYWDMFAPNPMQVDSFATAEVFFADGTRRSYTYPRMSELSIPEKYVKERYRKLFERVHLDENGYMWPAFGQRIALTNATNPRNPPIRVRLHRHWLAIAGPGKPQDAQYSDFMFFDYTVDQSKLAQDAGWR